MLYYHQNQFCAAIISTYCLTAHYSSQDLKATSPVQTSRMSFVKPGAFIANDHIWLCCEVTTKSHDAQEHFLVMLHCQTLRVITAAQLAVK